MKLGIVYTSTTPELIECVNEEIRKNLGDTPEILNYQDPSILAEVREHGYVTAGAAAHRILDATQASRLFVLMRKCAVKQLALARE